MALEGNIAYSKVNKSKKRHLKLLTDFSYPCTGTCTMFKLNGQR